MPGWRYGLPFQSSKELLLKLLHLKLQADPPQAGILGLTLDVDPRSRRSHSADCSSPVPEPDKLDLLAARLKASLAKTT